jgi:hypothetical protein
MRLSGVKKIWVLEGIDIVEKLLYCYEGVLHQGFRLEEIWVRAVGTASSSHKPSATSLGKPLPSLASGEKPSQPLTS